MRPLPVKNLPVKSWMRRLWWFDVVYPIAVGLLIFSSLTHIVYSGQRSSRLALLGEQKLLEETLTLGAGRAASHRGEVLIVSADALDVKRLGRAPLGVAPEPTAESFAAVIGALSKRGIHHIFVRWSMDAHPNDAVYYAPLVETLAALPPDVDVRFATSSSMLEATPEAFQKLVQNGRIKIAEDETCNYPERLQSDCPSNPDWPDWVMQGILEEALPDTERNDTPWITQEMPSIAPSYILNLPAPHTIPTQSFSSLLASEGVHPGGAASVAFVGADLAHTLSRTNDSSVTRFVHTAYDAPDLDFTVAGTPLHVFWAMTSQMFHDRAMVRVPSDKVVLATTVALCGVILLVMLRFGGTASTGFFLFFTVGAALFNAWSTRSLFLYVPLFDAVYFGLSTFIVAGFGRLSYTAFHRWRLTEQRRMHAHTADLKGNFISLLSHNLNTPVAKMQGMLGILATAPGAAPWKTDVRTAEFHVTQLEYAIRSVLVASALEEGSLAPAPRSLKALLDECVSVYGSSLKRLGVTLTTALAGDDDLAHMPLNLDVRAITAAQAGLAALFAREGSAVAVRLVASVEEHDDPRLGTARTVRFTLSSADGAPPASALRILTDASASTVRGLAGQAFFSDVLAGLGAQAARAYDGSVAVGAGAASGSTALTVTLREPPGTALAQG